MRIFDFRWAGPHGIGRFAREMQARMPDFIPAQLVGRPSSPFDPFKLRGYLRQAAPQLFFSPGYNPPIGVPCPFVFCVHDLNHLNVKENSSLLKRAYYKHIIRPAIYQARVLVTGSEFSRGQISEWSGANPSHIVAVGYGVSEAFSIGGNLHDEGGRPYFICVGNHKAHKNLLRTMQAFASRFTGTDYLILCTGTASTPMQQEINRLGICSQVKFVGAVSDEVLATLYRGAQALVFVSLFEGFGLPIIESMACGGPVITSNTTATPEVAGDAAILVDPLDVEAIGDSMLRLANDEGLRNMLRERGLRRAGLFSWELTAGKLRRALEICE